MECMGKGDIAHNNIKHLKPSWEVFIGQLVRIRGGTHTITYAAKGAVLLNIKVGSEVTNCVWTYYVHIFSLCAFPSVGLQCALNWSAGLLG